MPLVGLGCVAGAAGIARLHDYLVGHPDDTAVLVAVELCSLTVQRDDVSVPNLVASGLFGDGAAAVVATGAGRTDRAGRGARHPQPALPRHASARWASTSTGNGLRIVLDAEVPAMVARYIRGDVDDFLADHGLARGDIGWWVCHPGGPKVIEALEEALEVPRDALAADLGLAGPRRQPVVGLGAARPGGHPARAAAGGRHLRRADGDGARASAPSWCCCARPATRHAEASVTTLIAFTVLVVLVGLERVAELVVSTRNAAWSKERGGVETGLGHYPFMVVLHTGLLVGALVEAWVRRPDVPVRARLVDARAGARLAGAALVVHRDPRPALEHPGDRRARAWRR